MATLRTQDDREHMDPLIHSAELSPDEAAAVAMSRCRIPPAGRLVDPRDLSREIGEPLPDEPVSESAEDDRRDQSRDESPRDVEPTAPGIVDPRLLRPDSKGIDPPLGQRGAQ